ncbi:MAG: hypothetical protein E7406_08475 [Ruminococcaceae bacterium]|nr:hypothetical protein [Oscillospiraceae bacterium]
MNIKLELLKSYIKDYINNNLQDFEIDASEIADSKAINILAEIQNIIRNENYSDFDVVEKIVCIFEKYSIDAGFRHDF